MNDQSGYYSCSVNPSYISTWFTSFKKGRRGMSLNSLFEKDNTPAIFKPANLANNQHNGKISATAYKKIKKAIDYTVYLAAPKSLPDTIHGKNFKFRLNLITLTLSSPQSHSDNDIKNKVFQPMLNTFRDKYGVINYIWRAEKQGNGNIHFHVITDKFIPWNELRNSWNKHQNKLGYIDRYRSIQENWHRHGFQIRTEFLSHWSEEKQREAWKNGTKTEWNNPNSTDVHSLRTVTNIKSYFVKYLTKDNQSAYDQQSNSGQYSNLAGRLWGCSSRLSNIKGARADLDSQLSEELQKLTADKDIKNFKSDFFAISYINMETLIRKGYVLIPQLFEHYIAETFPEYRPPDLFLNSEN